MCIGAPIQGARQPLNHLPSLSGSRGQQTFCDAWLALLGVLNGHQQAMLFFRFQQGRSKTERETEEYKNPLSFAAELLKVSELDLCEHVGEVHFQRLRSVFLGIGPEHVSGNHQALRLATEATNRYWANQAQA